MIVALMSNMTYGVSDDSKEQASCIDARRSQICSVFFGGEAWSGIYPEETAKGREAGNASLEADAGPRSFTQLLSRYQM